MFIFKNENFSEIYKELLKLTQSGVVTNVDGVYTRDVENVMFQLDNPKSCIFKNPHRSSKLNYILRELDWYFNGTYCPKLISQKAPIWDKIKDENGLVQSNYGAIIKERNQDGFNSWYWCVNNLINDKHSRKAVMVFNRPQHAKHGVKDFVCTMYAKFSIVNNQLNMKVSMRSQDIILGLPNDIAFFSTLHQNMFNILKNHHTCLQLGTYTHAMDSLHSYECDWNDIETMLKLSFKPMMLDIGDKLYFDAYGSVDGDKSHFTHELFRV